VDPVLTAFAQLGTLRLDAQRTLISLFSRNEQHVLTEATRTLSLQDDTDHNHRDELWLGSCTVSYDRSFCKTALKPVVNAQTPSDRVVVVPDLTQDEEFKDHPDVNSFPNVRFLASSPIISPKGIVIGAYTVLDDKPHDPLDVGLLKFLADVGATVMNYLEASRARNQHVRSERMIVGLGSFLEGKGSLRNSWLHESDTSQPQSDKLDTPEGHVNQQEQEKQASQDVHLAMARNGPSSHLPFHPYNLHIPRNQTPQINEEEQQSVVNADTSKRDAKAQFKLDRTSQAAITEGDEHQSPRETYTAKVQETFSRAANLIRESIEVEAVVFFDAKFRSQESLVNNSKSETESSSDDETKGREALAQPDLLGTEHDDPTGKLTLNPCQILGFSTSSASSVSEQPNINTEIALSESFLGGLLRRYPRGKIFNFGENGTISSDDTSDGVFKSFFRRTGGKKYKRTRKALVRQDAEALLKLAPDSRSIVFSPLWDSHKGRWYSGSLTWTRSSHRVFTPNDELAFLLAFGNSVMAEVHRLGAHFSERAKSDLLAGLSHELRSPLHGIFGTAELLNDTVIDALQRGFVHTIGACAFTLLGSINQLLEYASINDVRPNSIAKTPGGTRHKSYSGRSTAEETPTYGKIDVDSYVELDSAVEDVIETVFAGFSFFDNSRSPLRGIAGFTSPIKPFVSQGGVKVILDIEHSKSWKFSTRPGAWHVILTNILGNALKFTQSGYIHISLKATPIGFGTSGEATRSEVTVIIKDTGCGIDPDYLKNGLFTAFSQEDSMTTGNGLGFNITRRIVSSLGGVIHVNSQKDVGTEVITTVTLDHVSELDTSEGLDTRVPVPMTKALVHDKTIGVLGLGTSELDTALCSSLQKLCRDWFGMHVSLVVPSQTHFDHCDFYISPHEYLDLGNLEIKPIAPDPHTRFPSPVIIICSSPRIAHSMSANAQRRGDTDVFEFISQPCGPRKLANTLEICIKRQQQRLDMLSGKHRRRQKPGGSSTTDEEESSLFNTPTSGFSEDPKIDLLKGPMTLSSQAMGGFAGPDGSFYEVDSPYMSPIASGDDPFLAKELDPTAEPRPVPPMTVLLVDDNDINLRLLIAFMKRLKCDYALAQNGEEALNFFKANACNISIIIMGK
jgi:signal transduction histidine kinase